MQLLRRRSSDVSCEREKNGAKSGLDVIILKNAAEKIEEKMGDIDSIQGSMF
jgi:hypothetical protein